MPDVFPACSYAVQNRRWRLAKRQLVAWSMLTATSLVGAWARADLASDVDAVLLAFGGHPTRHLGPRVVGRGTSLPLLLPNDFLVDKESLCTELVVLSSLVTQFELRMADTRLGPLNVPSRAGMIDLSVCGKRRLQLGSAHLSMLSPNGVVEVLVRNTEGPVKLVRQALHHRALDEQSSDQAGSPEVALQGSAPARVAELERLARLGGASAVTSRRLETGEALSGTSFFALPQGCHQVVLVSDPVSASSTTGLLVTRNGIEVEERIGQSIPGSLFPEVEFCLLETSEVEVSLWPPPTATQVTLHMATFPLSAAVPPWVPPRAAIQMALGLSRHHLQNLAQHPDLTFMVGGGRTQLKVPVLPTRCYLIMLAEAVGEVESLLLTVETAWEFWFDTTDGSLPTAALGFCAHGASSATVTTSLGGTKPAAILGLWSIATPQESSP